MGFESFRDHQYPLGLGEFIFLRPIFLQTFCKQGQILKFLVQIEVFIES